MNINRVNDYIDAYAKAIDMPLEYINIVKELMVKIITKYEKIYPQISVQDDDYDKYVIKPQNGQYTTEDFFLNRLMRNVWYIKYDAKTEGQYFINRMTVKFNKEKMKTQLSNQVPTDLVEFKEWDEIANKKVVMHEFEHALQTSFKKGTLDNDNKIIYQKIFEEVGKIKNGKYANEIYNYQEIDKLNVGTQEIFTHSGVLYSNQILNIPTYNHVQGIEEFNEILNETESLEMAEAKEQGTKHYKKNNTYFRFRNIESNNCYITNYGDLVKILIGKKLSFIGMYLNPHKFLRAFNYRYNDIFQKEFKNDMTAIENLIIQIKKIKDTDDVYERLKLEKVLAKCLEKKITLRAGKVKESTIKKDVEIFKKMMLTSDEPHIKCTLEHINILYSIQRNIQRYSSHDTR